jgi:DNA segregation ATPase, ftsK/spoIIIE family
LPLWTATVHGADRVQEFLTNQLKPYLTTETTPGLPRVAVFVEQFSELAGSPADSTLAESLKLARRNGHLLIGAGEIATMSGFNSSMPELKGARQGLLLQPEMNDGDLLKAQLPRVRAADFPPGRGYWIAAGDAVRVQIPEVD